MITATERPEAGYWPDADESTILGPILVATDGTKSAESALRAAATMARHAEADVVVLSVLEGLPLVAGDYGMIIPPIDTDETRRQALLGRVRDQLNALGSGTAGWKIEIRDGDPATTIARAASELGARVIILGLGHHDLFDRIFGGETTIHTLRHTKIPVLAVPP